MLGAIWGQESELGTSAKCLPAAATAFTLPLRSEARLPRASRGRESRGTRKKSTGGEDEWQRTDGTGRRQTEGETNGPCVIAVIVTDWLKMTVLISWPIGGEAEAAAALAAAVA